jgi:hypothetical protein
MNTLTSSIVIGSGATAVMDLWGLVRRQLFGTPLANYGLVGRWLGHMPQGRFRHAAIARAAPVAGEQLLGLAAHYVTGIAFAATLLALAGQEWLQQPRLLPALLTGVGTVVAPFLLMQPAMGAGFAAARTPHPAAARRQSLVTHLVFGLGLYISASALRLLQA